MKWMIHITCFWGQIPQMQRVTTGSAIWQIKVAPFSLFSGGLYSLSQNLILLAWCYHTASAGLLMQSLCSTTTQRCSAGSFEYSHLMVTWCIIVREVNIRRWVQWSVFRRVITRSNTEISACVCLCLFGIFLGLFGSGNSVISSWIYLQAAYLCCLFWGQSASERILWLIFTHLLLGLVFTLLSLVPLRWGLWWGKGKGRRGPIGVGWNRKGRKCQGLWSSYGVCEAAIGRVILPLPLASILSMTPPLPHHDKLDKLGTKEPRATSSLFLFSYPVVFIPFVVYTASVKVSWQGLADTARLGCRALRPGKEVRPVAPVAEFGKPLNGLRHIY